MTILEHLQQLPEKYREAAIRNTLNDELPTGYCNASEDLISSLRGAFLFNNSPEGKEYWINVTKELEAL